MNDRLCLDPLELSLALVSTALRKVGNYYFPVPWLVFPALRFLSKEVPDKEVFEFGSGTSTLWYAKRCRHIISIEDDPEWFERQTARMQTHHNVQVIFETDPDSYANKLRSLGRLFDIVIVDGSHRLKCLRNSVDWVRPGGCIVVDNTDQQGDLADFARQSFPAECLSVLSGYAPGNFYAKETTIIRVPS